MPFPPVSRVIFGKNPLDKVICQLRFPPILRIDTEIPADFQDRIRDSFPNYSEAAEFTFEVPQQIRDAIPPGLADAIIPSSGSKNYTFSSEDEEWVVTLTRNFIALTANHYGRWEEFEKQLRIPLDALKEVYSPGYFSRIGLRYIDVIRRSVLGLGDTDWCELLAPHILGILSSDVSAYVRTHETRDQISLSDGVSIVRMITKFVTPVDDDEEICFVIDSDFFEANKTDIDAALEKLDYFHTRGTRLFQWCITDKLHQALEPHVP